ncbi:beta-1,4-N-acetylgalactosaminyltransferase bre-4 [Cephus cinctus]|uniref:Beta-1,4-N-acetylgalactosaminyltransferase n=1 Tax=Cephus cinctus TaxID=211228 RepID=A0AAJ7FKY0_CEPCN|nr:beta-1,4-N-acetylgalactosaminyltransferase bre-4 [Cephus cinctus]XP_015596919.1 beta-1,4-N-acetylgalactosaminyltransferase bre-4 [Cephus cinctus]XP_015596920.1 beta-1,4-N-acetylgalactosaminyltransferase bre-4 [Cephus cinctus]XP_015596921.1 beta-1,4-N-acetylgalactosaminyltransferase bre-4 [Cephus cinctus]XP_024941587.1 beta-1,4-N-acetylgalactosaminyltransferase bre-4 [Cephus cinctus]XP_024941588.1 beta-1,4-N-acetylgalactosaminyltransferase bre-4 [Cephus cinctus]XP_024941589.1 beta-1,4-N-ace
MSLAAAVALWHRAHLYKALACLVLALIALQYLLSGILDRRSIETIFTINATRYADHSYRNHPRGLIIYGPATASTYSRSTNGNVSSMTFLLDSVSRAVNNNVSRSEAAPTGTSGGSTGTGSGSGSGGSAVFQDVLTHNNTDSILLERCPLIPPNLIGPVTVNTSPPELPVIEKTLADVKHGGKGWPSECIARHKVAIIIPYRDRSQHLQTLLYNLHPILLRQQINYQIFVVEQEGNGQFNRAMLMNVGYTEALKERLFDCFIFHDVDLLPEDDRNLYTCPEQPRHMSVAVDKFKYRLPYADIFGGVSAMSREHFRLVNGFSNAFWGWGAEDDDMANRVKAHGLHISRYPANIARYKMLTHKKEKANPKRYEYLKTGRKRFASDGLTNLRYELVKKEKPKLYTWLLVRISPPQPS